MTDESEPLAASAMASSQAMADAAWFAIQHTLTLPTEDAARTVARRLAERGHRLVAVREYGHFSRDRSSSWFGKPLIRPELAGWWQVFSLDEGPYAVDAWASRWMERDAVAALARSAGGFVDGGGEGRLETMRRGFTRVGLAFELTEETALSRRPASPAEAEPSPPEGAPLGLQAGEPGGKVELPDLDAVPWRSLSHAHGGAEDVPAMLSALAANDARWRDALDELIGSVHHQGDCATATPAVVPFLAELAASPRLAPARRLELLAHLLGMATSGVARMVWTSDQAAAGVSRPPAPEAAATAAAIDTVVGHLLARWDDESPAARLVLAALAAACAAGRPYEPAIVEFAESLGDARQRALADLTVALLRSEAAATLTTLERIAAWDEGAAYVLAQRSSPAAARALVALTTAVQDEAGRALTEA